MTTEDKVIEYLKNLKSGEEFSKRDCYNAIGLEVPTSSFNKFWKFLTRKRFSGDYLIFNDDGKWIYFD